MRKYQLRHCKFRFSLSCDCTHEVARPRVMANLAMMSGAGVRRWTPPASRARSSRVLVHLSIPRGRNPTIRRVSSGIVAEAASAVDARQLEYAAWRKERGVQAKNVEVAYFGDVDDTVMRYRGVKAMGRVNEGDVLCELPRESCLVLADDAELPFPDFCTNELWAKLVEKNKWAIRVALNLLCEVDKGASSGFHPYISQLPKDFDLLSEWTDEELKELQYPPAVRAAEAQRKENDEAMELLRKHSPGTLQSVTPEKMAWALNMVRSRVFSGRLSDNAVTKANLLPRALAAGTAFAAFLTSQTTEGRWLAVFAMLALVVFDANDGDTDPGSPNAPKLAYVLMPLIDAFNHRTMPKTEFEFSSDAFRLRSPAGYAAGEEVFISYGLLGNDELAVRYGFVDPTNDQDTCVYDGLLAWLRANHEPLKKAAGAAPDRAKAVRDARLETYASMAVIKANGEADSNVLWALRCMLATPEEWAAAGGNAEGMKLGGGAPEKAACTALAAACRARLESMGTTLEEDREKLERGASGRERIAIQYRARKKEILRACVDRYDVK